MAKKRDIQEIAPVILVVLLAALMGGCCSNTNLTAGYFGYNIDSGHFDLDAQINARSDSVLQVMRKDKDGADVFEVSVTPDDKTGLSFSTQRICVAGPEREIVGVQLIASCANEAEKMAFFDRVMNYFGDEMQLEKIMRDQSSATFMRGDVSTVVSLREGAVEVVCAKETLMRKYHIKR